jgi:hypothetical protein
MRTFFFFGIWANKWVQILWLHYVRINRKININGKQNIKGREKIRHIHGTPRKTSVDLNAPEDLTEATKSPNFY